MSNEDVVTMDKIMTMLDEATGFKLDASQRDGVRVVLEAYAIRLAEDYGATPAQLAEAHIHSLMTLARQLLDTGTIRTVTDVSKDIRASEDRMKAWQVEVLKSISYQQPDISGLRDQLWPEIKSLEERMDALTRTVLAAQGQHSGEVTEFAGDLKELCEEIDGLRALIDGLKMPDAFIPLQRVSAEEFVEQQLSIGNGLALDPEVPDPGGMPQDQYGMPLWERELLEKQAAVDSAIQVIAEINAAERASNRRGVNTKAKNNPGCFFNEDGTITCRICGKPKDPNLFHRDKQAQTGRRSKCAQCDHDALMASKQTPPL